MTVQVENVRTQDGTMEMFIARPDGAGPFPVIVQIMDALGMREELRSHARRAASWGYYVIAPDLFYRHGLKGPIDVANPENMQAIMAAVNDLGPAHVTNDVHAALEIVNHDPAARNGRIGLFGFCMGGKLTLQLAQTLGDRVAACASVHPGGLVTQEADSPHRHLDQIKAKLYFGIADQDQSATPDQITELEKALGAQGIDYRLEWHPGALHGYMMPSRPGIYDRKAAEAVWDRMETLFAHTLMGG